jgi:hypothetical protein
MTDFRRDLLDVLFTVFGTLANVACLILLSPFVNERRE